MNLVILRISSPSLKPEVGGLPENVEYFDLEVEVMLAPKDKEADDITFAFSVTSPSALCDRRLGDAFVAHTLVISAFSWAEVCRHVERLLMQVKSCASWECVAFRLAPFMRPLGATFNAL